jgi:hypothetical protein
LTSAPTLEMVVGKSVAHVWLGDYSSLYLELGTLSPGRRRRDGSIGNASGEITIYAGYDWRIERIKSIVGGRNVTAKKRYSIVEGLLQRTIEAIEVSSRIPELQIRFSSGLWLVTFNPNAGQPVWSVSFNTPDLGDLCVDRGNIHVFNKGS